jgi:hypothetical protein
MLTLATNGRVVVRLRRHRRDGTSAVAFDPLTFIERLRAPRRPAEKLRTVGSSASRQLAPLDMG